MTRPAWHGRRAPRAPLDVARMLAAGGLIESPFRWCQPMQKPATRDWTAWLAFALALAGAGVAAKIAGVW